MLLILAILIGILVMPVSAQTGIRVTVNGIPLAFEVPPQMINGRTMVPMRAIFEALGAKVNWDGSTQTITATTGDREIIMQLNNTRMTVNGRAIELDVPPQLVNSSTLVPVRAVAEGLDADVNWIADTQTVVITKGGSGHSGQGQSLATRPARYPELATVYGYRNTRLDEVQHDARYLFEQDVLPSAVYYFEDDLIDLIKSRDIEEIISFVYFHWGYVAAYVIADDLLDIGVLNGSETEDEIVAILLNSLVEYRLNDTVHVRNVTIENITGGATAIIVEMSDPGWNHVSTFIGIVYDESTGLHVFTLERSFLSEVFMFCYIDEFVRGAIGPVENNRAAFLNAIREALR